MFSKFNLKNLTFLVAALLSVTFFASCSDDDAPVDNTITGKVTADANFSILEKAVVKAGLGTTLSGTGPFTVFAPDDAAFNASGLPSAAIDAINATDLQRVLLYHTLAAKVLSSEVPAGPNAKVATANSPSDSIFVTRNSSGVYINGIKVKTADLEATNGVIHIIERVLLPPSGNLVATAQANLGGDNGLDSLVAALVRADAASPGLIQLLNSNTLTAFAPTNKAFRDLLTALSLPDINSIPLATLSAALAYHLVPGRAFSSDLTAGSLSMFAGGNTTISLTGPTIKGSSNATASNIIATNIMATNGVVHVIDQVLLP